MTAKAVALGVFLALVFGAANAYLGMRAGQTVAATLPAAVIAMALFRIPAFRGGILEQNIARTAASVGEALVAGAIFTIPAFVMVEYGGARLWTDLRTHYWDATLILLCGGLLGVFFIILLRRPLCVDADLPWPESVAAANIVKASGENSDAPKLIFTSMAFAGLIQFLKTDKGLQIFREYTEGFLAFPRAVISHFNFAKQPIGAVTHAGGIPMDDARTLAGPHRDRFHHWSQIRIRQRRRWDLRLVDSHSPSALLRSRPVASRCRNRQWQ